VEWLDLVVPSVAILAAFAVIALIVTVVRQGRAIRRLEERLARSGDSAVDAPLQRIADLQARHATSSRSSPDIQRQLRVGAVVGVSALVLVALIGGIWYLFIRDDNGSASADTGPQAATRQQTQTAPAAPPPDQALVPDEVPQIDKGAHTVAVFNASGIDGVAGDLVAPALENEGYQVPLVANPPDGDTDRQATVVMYSPGSGNRRAAQNVASDLGVARAPPLDGYTPDQVGEADVIVLVGLDIANNGIDATP
jgi:LytR cell envelope-related transcriptional attenuator